MSQFAKQIEPLKFKRRLAYIDVNDISPNDDNPRDPIAKKSLTLAQSLGT
jgi:hypothetical protein